MRKSAVFARRPEHSFEQFLAQCLQICAEQCSFLYVQHIFVLPFQELFASSQKQGKPRKPGKAGKVSAKNDKTN